MSEKSKTFSSSNINNSNKSSIRRLNHQISSEQQRRLAPVFENSGPFNSNVHKLRNQFNVDTNTNLNQQLFFLRKNLNKTYETAAEVCKDMPTQTANGKSSESIYKSKGSLMGSNYNSICELEKRAGSILMNKNFSPKGIFLILIIKNFQNAVYYLTLFKLSRQTNKFSASSHSPAAS